MKGKSKNEVEMDDPDYRYWDFRDEIRDVERMRTIGGKNGKNKNEEEGKKEAKPSR